MVKDPWEVYFDLVRVGAGGREMPKPPVDLDSDEARAFIVAFQTARDSTVASLIRDQEWAQGPAADLGQEFLKASIAWLNNGHDLGLPGLKVRLRHRYEDWDSH